jgi:hypothetical protein
MKEFKLHPLKEYPGRFRGRFWFSTGTKIVALVIATMLMTSCIPFTHVELPHNGVAIDHDTKKPIDGVVVDLHLASRWFLGSSANEDAYETLTDKDGRFHTPLKFKHEQLGESYSSELYFNKVGYFPARTLSPGLSNDVELYRIKSLSDFRGIWQDADRDMGLSFIDRVGDKSQLFKKEMLKISTVTLLKVGEPGFIAEIPGTQLDKIDCGDFDDYRLEKGVIHQIEGVACIVHDKLSGEWFALTPYGEFFPFSKMEPEASQMAKDYPLYSHGKYNFVFADKDSIFTTDVNLKVTKEVKTKKAIKGGITALAGAHDQVTIEKNGRYVCGYSDDPRGPSKCFDIQDVGKCNSDGKCTFLLLDKRHKDSFGTTTFTVARCYDKYVMYVVRRDDDRDHRNDEFTITELFSFTADDELKSFSSSSFLFANKGLKSYLMINEHRDKKNITLAEYLKVDRLEDDQVFNDMIKSNFVNSVVDFDSNLLGLYIVTGGPKLYRITGREPDYQIQIKSQK